MFKKPKSGMVTSEEAHAEAERIGNAIIDAAMTDMGSHTRFIPDAMSRGVAGAIMSVCNHHGIDPMPVAKEIVRLVSEEQDNPDVEAN